MACIGLLASIATATSIAEQDNFAGSWHGAISLPGNPLYISVDLQQDAEGWKGAIDVPQQGTAGVALEEIAIEGVDVRFTMSAGSGEPTFIGRLVEGRITGNFQQSGNNLPFFLGREPVKIPEPITEEKAVQIIDGHLAAYNAHDREALLGFFHPDIEVYAFPNELLASGLDALRQEFSFDQEPHEKVVARIVEGNHVIDKVEHTIQVNGQAETERSTVIYTIEDGLIRHMRFL